MFIVEAVLSRRHPTTPGHRQAARRPRRPEQPGDAVKQMTEVSALVKRCAHFTTQAVGGKAVKMSTTSKPLAHLGDQALDVKVTPTGPYVADEIILVRSGNVIMAVDADSQSGPMPALKPLATRLAKRLPLKS